MDSLPTDAPIDAAIAAPKTDQPPAILDQISFSYHASAKPTSDASPIIDNISASLLPGRITALIGPNAAGKSTLLRLLLGDLKPTAGGITLIDRDASHLRAAERAACISYVPQRGQASFAFTVEQVIALGRYAVGPDPQAVDRAIDRTELQPLRDRIYQELSVGQQQRVLFARAIAQADPAGQIMLLDEPGSAMDLWHVHHLMRTLRDLANTGMAILVAVHDLNLAMRYADDVWLIDQGQLVQSGSWQNVMDPAILEPVYRMPMRLIHLEQPDSSGAPHPNRPILVINP